MEAEEQKEGQEEKEKKKRKSWWTKCKERFANYLMAGRKEVDVEKKGRKSNRCPKARHALEKLVVYRCCSGRFTEKDGNVENNAATGSSGRSDK